MTMAFGARFDDADFATTNIDTETGVVTVTGEIAGESFEVELVIGA